MILLPDLSCRLASVGAKPLYSDTSFENPDEVLNPAIALTLTDEIFNNESRPSVQKRAEAELSIRLAVYAARKADLHAAATATHDKQLVDLTRALVWSTAVLAVATIVLVIVTAVRS